MTVHVRPLSTGTSGEVPGARAAALPTVKVPVAYQTSAVVLPTVLSVGELALKGFHKPVPAYRLLDVPPAAVG